MEKMVTGLSFYKGRRVFVTGHTGFKGAWLCRVLINSGAKVTGYSLTPPTSPSLFELAGIGENMDSVIGDVRDLDSLKAAFDRARPEIVFHMAAQPLVRDSYNRPAYTYETNVMGTVNILECVRLSGCVRSFVNVTTDKVYENKEWEWGYRENENLCGFDPYSNSKSCSELVTHSYKNSFFGKTSTAISTARSGNVIGGGDFAADRIIPDCVRAVLGGQKIVIRNPHSTRPYQYVLECLSGYLLLAQRQFEDRNAFEGCYNFGPDERSCVTTGELVRLFCEIYGGADYEIKSDVGPHEANFLKLDCSKAKKLLGWQPRLNIREGVARAVEFTHVYRGGGDIVERMDEQIGEYFRV